MSDNPKIRGYGEVPTGWSAQAINDFGFDISDGNYADKYPSQADFVEAGVPFIRSNNIKHGRLVRENLRFITPVLHAELTRGHLKQGDILITTRGELGKLAIVDTSFVGSNINAQLVRINVGNKLDTKYFFYFLNYCDTYGAFREIETGTALKQLPVNRLRTVLIAFPDDVLEQQKIAKILSTVDNLIEKTQSLIEKYTAIKQGMMADLFTRGIDMTTVDTPNAKGSKLRPSVEDAPELYKQTELGWVPKEWEVLSFGELADYKNGNSFSADSWKEEGYPIIRIQNLNGSNEYNYYEGPVKSIWHVLPGDLLFAWSGQKGVSFGARIWNGPEGVLNQHIFKVYENSKLLTRQFLYYLFKLNVGRIEDNAHGFKDSFVHVTRSELTDVKVMVPPKEEQSVIEQRVISLDRKLDQELESLEKYKKLKKGLMQDLLTGKVQVS